jgi:alkanesulfonate monooxygenase SsuD/methylene tetrahydromethanopterin reductase-like flavin-dependent oxidoreductase (luciferase family)
VLRRLFRGETVTFQGDHVRLTDLVAIPPSFRPEGPPILIGGGAKRVLTFAGAEADIVGVNASIHSGEIDASAAHDALASRIDEKVAWVKATGRFDDVEINAWLAAAEVTDDTPGLAALMGQLFEAEPDDVLASPLTLIGSAAEIVDRLQERRDRWGYSYHVIPGDKARDFAPIVARLTGS